MNAEDFPTLCSSPLPRQAIVSILLIFDLFLNFQFLSDSLLPVLFGGNCGRLKNVPELGSLSPCLVSSLSLSDAPIFLSYLGVSLTSPIATQYFV